MGMVVDGVLRLVVRVPDLLESRFFLLLQSGFQVRAQMGCSVRRLLGEQLGLSPDYIQERIRTLFLDGHPVDDMGTAVVQDGSVLALSGALPGLVGATLRLGGYYGCLRDSITYQPPTAGSDGSRSTAFGTITVKLFNLVLKDLGSQFLSQGVLLPATAVEDFFRTQLADFWDAAPQVRIEGEPMAEALSRHQLLQLGADAVLLRVTTAAHS
jgi:hypothetical protein